jgi:hypothetical protein
MSAILLERTCSPLLAQAAESDRASRHRLRPVPPPWQKGSDAHREAVFRAYRRTGGLASGDEMTMLLRRRTSQPISMLGRWIVEGRVVNFSWQGEYLLPLFQFDLADLTLRADVNAVLAELAGAFDDWDLATWFALPNSWLAGAAPVDALERRLVAVLDAARADRYIARG